jgi:type IV secretion system protein TrbL
MLNGTVAMSLQSAGTAAGMVGAAPVAAGLATGAAGARALGLAGGALGALMPVQKAAGAIGGSSVGVGFGGGISGMVNPVNSFQPSANASSGGTSLAGGLGAAVQSGMTDKSGGGTGSHLSAHSPSPSPPPSDSPVGWQGLNADSQSFGQTQAPGFVNARFDPFASPRDGGSGISHPTSNETGGMPANSFDARSAQQRFEADYRQEPSGVADKLNGFSKRLQYAADRRKPHWVSDGHVGHAPGLRMGLDS